MIIDVWMQHPTSRFLALDIFASLRRWTGGAIPEDPPGIEATVAVKIAERRLVSEGHDCAGLLFEQQRVPHESAVTT